MQGFTGDNLTCKGLLCLEQSKMRGKSNKYSEQSGWEHRAGSGCRVFQVHLCCHQPLCTCILLCFMLGLPCPERKQCLSTLQTGMSLEHAQTYLRQHLQEKGSSVNNSRKTAIEKCNISKLVIQLLQTRTKMHIF